MYYSEIVLICGPSHAVRLNDGMLSGVQGDNVSLSSLGLCLMINSSVAEEKLFGWPTGRGWEF